MISETSIRRARLTDAIDISRIAELNSVTRIASSPSKITQLSQQGFLFYPLPASSKEEPDFSERIELLEFFYVAEVNHTVAGYILASTFKKLSALQRKTDNDISVLKHFNDKSWVYPSSSYISQIAVHPLHKRSSIGAAMLDTLITDMKEHEIPSAVAEIAEWPHYNQASANLFKSRKFTALDTRIKDKHAPRVSRIFNINLLQE